MLILELLFILHLIEVLFIKISNIENNLDNSSFNIENYTTNDIIIVNHIELNSDVETSSNVKSIFISNEGYISKKNI